MILLQNLLLFLFFWSPTVVGRISINHGPFKHECPEIGENVPYVLGLLKVESPSGNYSTHRLEGLTLSSHRVHSDNVVIKVKEHEAGQLVFFLNSTGNLTVTFKNICSPIFPFMRNNTIETKGFGHFVVDYIVKLPCQEKKTHYDYFTLTLTNSEIDAFLNIIVKIEVETSGVSETIDNRNMRDQSTWIEDMMLLRNDGLLDRFESPLFCPEKEEKAKEDSFNILSVQKIERGRWREISKKMLSNVFVDAGHNHTSLLLYIRAYGNYSVTAGSDDSSVKIYNFTDKLEVNPDGYGYLVLNMKTSEGKAHVYIEVKDGEKDIELLEFTVTSKKSLMNFLHSNYSNLTSFSHGTTPKLVNVFSFESTAFGFSNKTTYSKENGHAEHAFVVESNGDPIKFNVTSKNTGAEFNGHIENGTFTIPLEGNRTTLGFETFEVVLTNEKTGEKLFSQWIRDAQTGSLEETTPGKPKLEKVSIYGGSTVAHAGPWGSNEVKIPRRNYTENLVIKVEKIEGVTIKITATSLTSTDVFNGVADNNGEFSIPFEGIRNTLGLEEIDVVLKNESTGQESKYRIIVNNLDIPNKKAPIVEDLLSIIDV